ncbi:MAG: TetR/AcrR family transcriptional regulator [Candidatus Aminicenantes bacterium]|nr:TetR/AcrR family transcriptional regulator [Candidatus Aminicenantes bacterium]
MKTNRVFKVSKASGPSGGAFPALRARIVEAAGALFVNRGFIRVTSDEIAGRLGISKATLYKAFPGKEAILRAVVRRIMNEILAGVERIIADDSLGFVEKMVALLSFLGARMARFEPVLIRDLQRHVPGIWKEIEEFRREKIYKNFRIILEAGRREGYFREDVDLELLLAMFVSLVQELINPAAILRSGRSPAETFRSVIKVFFQGILTDKGRMDFADRTPGLFEPLKEGVS